MSNESIKQEPVAWVEAWANGQVQAHEENCFSDDPVWLSNPIPLYTAPPTDLLRKEYERGYADAMNWKTQNHLEHLPPREKNT